MTRHGRLLLPLLLTLLLGCSGEVAVESLPAAVDFQRPIESDHFVADVTVSSFADGSHYLVVSPQDGRAGFVWEATKVQPIGALAPGKLNGDAM